MADTADHLSILTMNIYNLSTELEIDPNYSVKSLAQCLDSSKDKIDPESTSLPYTKTIPTLLLYDNKGLQIYDKITQGVFTAIFSSPH